MEKLKALLKNDKVLHGVMGLLMVAYCLGFYGLMQIGSGPAVAYAMAVGSGGVEAYQKARNEGVPSWQDWLAGSGLGALYWAGTAWLA